MPKDEAALAEEAYDAATESDSDEDGAIAGKGPKLRDPSLLNQF